jgi:hypothetical protein
MVWFKKTSLISLKTMMAFIIAVMAFSLLAQGQCAPAPSGMISWWSGDGHRLDLAGTNDGTMMNGATYAAGMVGQAFSLDGVDDYVDMGNSDAFNFGSGDFAISFWAKPRNGGGGEDYDHVIAKAATNSFSPYIIGIHDSKWKFWSTSNGSSWNIASDYVLGDVALNSWQYIVMTRAGNAIKFYKEGTLTATLATSSGLWVNTEKLLIGTTPWTAQDQHYMGLLDEVTIYNRALSSDEITAIYNAGSAGKCKPCFEPPPNMVAWWSGDNHPFDLMGTNDGTLMNGATYAAGMVGQAFSFDGADDYVEVGNDSSITNVTPSALTIEAWVYNTTPITTPAGWPGDLRAVVEQRSSSGLAGYGLEYGYAQGATSSGYLVTLYFPFGRQAIIDYQILPSQWYHIVGVFDDLVGTIYINGQAQSTATVGLGYTNSTDSVMIGRAGNSSEYYKYHIGFIDEAAIFNRALSSDEIAAIYNAGSAGKCKSNICFPSPSGMVSWWSGDRHPLDLVGTNDGTLMNGATYAAGMVGQGFSLDGANDFVRIPSAAELKPQNFTIDAWVFAMNAGSISDAIGPIIVSKDIGDTTSTSPGTSWTLTGPGNTGRFNAFVGFSDGSHPQLTSINSFSFSTFHHVAMTWNGSLLRLYVNDSLEGSVNLGSKTVFYNDDPISIGRHNQDLVGGTRAFNGFIDEVEIFNRALSASEILAIYNAGSSGKCKPCFAPPTGIVSWWRGEGDAIDCVGANDGSTENGATFAPGMVGQAFSLDGVDDYLDMGNSDAFNFGSGDFAISFWAKPRNGGGGNDYDHLIGKAALSSFTPYQIGIHDSKWKFWSTSNGSSWDIAVEYVFGDITAYSCQYIVISRAGNAINFYINGVQTATITTSSGLWVNTEKLLIGKTPWTAQDTHFNGLVDEVSFYNRALSASEIAAIFYAGSEGKCFSCASPSGITNNSAADISTCDTGVQITWTAPSQWGDDSTSGRNFDIFRDGSPIATGIPNGTSSHIDDTGANGTSYTYAVRHNNSCGMSFTTAGAAAADNADTTPPDTAGWNSLVANRNSGNVDLSWGAIGGPDTIGYNVYRDTISDSPWGPSQKINGSLISGTIYPDEPPAGDLLFYLIKAVDVCGNEAK